LLRGFPDRVAQATGSKEKSAAYRFCRGGGGELSRQSLAVSQPLILCLSLRERLNADRSERLLIERAAAIDANDLMESKNPLLRVERTAETTSDHRTMLYDVIAYGEIELSRKRVHVEVHSSENLALRLIASWPEPFGEPGLALMQNYNARAELYNAHNEAHLPIFTGEMLELFLSSVASDYESWRAISETSLASLITSQLDFHLAQDLTDQCPEQVRLENGKVMKVDYSSAAGPLLRGPIQDFYGCKALPNLCRGKVKITLELLGPNKRPMQRTSDLQSFWSKTYQELLREYQRNYPRHYWAENPMTAKPYLLVRHLPKA
jgi:ATP-dependent helicase HrpB